MESFSCLIAYLELTLILLSVSKTRQQKFLKPMQRIKFVLQMIEIHFLCLNIIWKDNENKLEKLNRIITLEEKAPVILIKIVLTKENNNCLIKVNIEYLINNLVIYKEINKIWNLKQWILCSMMGHCKNLFVRYFIMYKNVVVKYDTFLLG